MLDVYKNTTNINTDDTTDCKSLSLFVSPERNRFSEGTCLILPPIYRVFQNTWHYLQGVLEYLTQPAGCSRILDTIYRVFKNTWHNLQGVQEYLTQPTGCSRILDTTCRVFQNTWHNLQGVSEYLTQPAGCSPEG